MSPNAIRYFWHESREGLFRAIVAHAMMLVGVTGADLNRILAPVRKAESDERAIMIREMRKASLKARRGGKRE